MSDYTILCVDDEREVLDSIQYDLESLSSDFDVEVAESVDEAEDLIAELEATDRKLALILCDHIMPERLGVDFLIQLHQNETTQASRKLLLTGQAGLEATVEAVNRAGLHYYISKPWEPAHLHQIVIDQLTTYMIHNEDDLLPYVKVLDGTRLFEAMHERDL